MTITASRNFVAALVGAMALAGAAGTPAHASYLGYGNGDPGNWGFTMEQKGGPCAGVKARNGRMPSCCLHYMPQGMCPDMPRKMAYAAPPLSTIVN